MSDADFRLVWEAATIDVTGLVCMLDEQVARHGGDQLLATMHLAMSLDQNAPPGRCWLASRLAVALHLLNAATGPAVEKMARDITKLMTEQQP